jgi:hypothetical protein
MLVLAMEFSRITSECCRQDATGRSLKTE